MTSRKLPPVQVGDCFGLRTVTAILPKGAAHSQRVTWRCTCGIEGVGAVDNLRKFKGGCVHHARPTPLSSPSGGLSLQECADRLGISTHQVAVIEEQALRKLQALARDAGLTFAGVAPERELRPGSPTNRHGGAQ